MAAVDLREVTGGGVAVRGTGRVQEAIWNRRAVSFRATWAEMSGQRVCTVLALADARGLAAS